MFKNNAFSLLDDDETNEVETKEENVKKNEDPLSKYYNIKQNVKKQEFNKNDPFKFNTLNKRKNNTVQVQKINKKEIHDNILNERPNNYLKIYAKHLMDKEWNNISNYLNLEDINEWGDVPAFYNSLKKNILRVKQFHIFVMKNNIYPLWEAEENRKGSIIKVRVNTIEETLTMMNTLTVYFLNNDI